MAAKPGAPLLPIEAHEALAARAYESAIRRLTREMAARLRGAAAAAAAARATRHAELKRLAATVEPEARAARESAETAASLRDELASSVARLEAQLGQLASARAEETMVWEARVRLARERKEQRDDATASANAERAREMAEADEAAEAVQALVKKENARTEELLQELKAIEADEVAQREAWAQRVAAAEAETRAKATALAAARELAAARKADWTAKVGRFAAELEQERRLRDADEEKLRQANAAQAVLRESIEKKSVRIAKLRTETRETQAKVEGAARAERDSLLGEYAPQVSTMTERFERSNQWVSELEYFLRCPVCNCALQECVMELSEGVSCCADCLDELRAKMATPAAGDRSRLRVGARAAELEPQLKSPRRVLSTSAAATASARPREVVVNPVVQGFVSRFQVFGLHVAAANSMLAECQEHLRRLGAASAARSPAR